jgi:hypothetical protein
MRDSIQRSGQFEVINIEADLRDCNDCWTLKHRRREGASERASAARSELGLASIATYQLQLQLQFHLITSSRIFWNKTEL